MLIQKYTLFPHHILHTIFQEKYVIFFSFWRYLNFYLDFLVMQKNGLIRKISLISKFMTSQPGKKTITINILSNISRGKDNQAMRFDQLINYNMRNIFLEKWIIHKMWWRNYSETLFQKSKLSISLDKFSKVLYSLFAKFKNIEIYWN